MPKTPASEDFKAAENGHIQKNPAEMPGKDDFFRAWGNSFYLYAQLVALSCYGLIQTRNCHGFCNNRDYNLSVPHFMSEYSIHPIPQIYGHRMRLLVILSPTDRWGTKTEYTMLRKFLHKDGYLRIAPEVYMRIVQNRKASKKHYRRIEEYTPKTGIVRLLRLTEKQYNNIYMVTGEPDYQE